MAERTAINPQTGQRLRWDGKKWAPVGATGVMSDTKTDQEALDRARKDAETADYQSRQAQEFVRLNQETGTGGLRALKPPLPDFLGGNSMLGDAFAGMTGPNWDTMKGITASAAPRNRVEGSGATSDFEARMMVAGFPSVEKRGDTNTQTAKRIANEQARARARASFLDTWMARNGTLLGADRAFQSWWTTYAAEKGLDTTSPRPVKKAPAGSTVIQTSRGAVTITPAK